MHIQHYLMLNSMYSGDNGVRGRDLGARHRAAARGVHVHRPAASARAAPRGVPHAVLCTHAAPAARRGRAARYVQHALAYRLRAVQHDTS